MAWKKQLWVHQPYPDNYVDKSFLSQLKHNSQVQSYEYWTVVSDASLFLGNLALTLIFGGAFLAIYRLMWDPQWFPALGGIITVALGIKWAVVTRSWSRSLRAAKSALILFFAVVALTPVFRSLTESTSSDSIWNMTIWLSIVNLAFMSQPLPANGWLLVVSMNMSLSAAIILASRLSTTVAVSSFMLFSIETYVVLPTVARWLRSTSPLGYWSLFIVEVAASDILLARIWGYWALTCWHVIKAAVLFGLPSLFLVLQRYKDQIEGPWDAATPNLD